MKGFADAGVSLPATITSSSHFKKLKEFLNAISQVRASNGVRPAVCIAAVRAVLVPMLSYQ
jgi:hypothetical protein